MLSKFTIGTIVLFLTSGCVPLPQPSKEVTPPTPALEFAGTQLLQAAKAVEHSLRILAQKESQDIGPIINTAPLLTEKANMGQKITLDWSGPIEPLLREMSDIAGYELKCFGRVPTIPIVISVVGNQMAVADIVKDAALQAGSKANVVVFPDNKIIELHYAST